jgi:hypothetical protein
MTREWIESQDKPCPDCKRANLSFLDQLDQWEKDLVSDGWTPGMIYDRVGTSGKQDKFTRDGFVIHIYRPPYFAYDDISAWGPDKVRIPLPPSYDFDAMKAALKVCGHCGEIVDKTEPVVLRTAMRVCPDCRKALARELLEPNKHF